VRKILKVATIAGQGWKNWNLKSPEGGGAEGVKGGEGGRGIAGVYGENNHFYVEGELNSWTMGTSREESEKKRRGEDSKVEKILVPLPEDKTYSSTIRLNGFCQEENHRVSNKRGEREVRRRKGGEETE